MWSHIPVTFSAQDVSLTTFPHIDAMVITAHVDPWDVAKVLINSGSQAKILFLSTFEKMSYNKKQLKEPTEPLLLRVITLPASFNTPRNPRT
jgi:hypothetical protein